MRFLQTSQNEFPVVIGTPRRDIGQARYYIATDFRGSGDPDRVSGTCAREEGLRTLTSPRREASLFKLGRSLVLRPILFLARPCRGHSQGTIEFVADISQLLSTVSESHRCALSSWPLLAVRAFLSSRETVTTGTTVTPAARSVPLPSPESVTTGTTGT